MTSGYVRRGLNTRIAAALDAKAERGELEWHTVTESGRLIYVVTPGAGVGRTETADATHDARRNRRMGRRQGVAS